MKFAIVNKPSSSVSELVAKIRTEAKKRGFIEDQNEPEVVFSIGGDGTLLRAVRFGKPIVAFKAGRRSFLADVEPDKVEDCLDRLKNSEYLIEDYSMLNVNGYDFFNDFAIMANNGKTITINISSGEIEVEFEGDGVVISTQQGSTGWSLSALGPYLGRGVDATVITLLNPILAPVRSYVVNNYPIVARVKPIFHTGQARTFVDGNIIGTVDEDTEILINRSNKRAKILRFYNERRKLTWTK
ncbi:NAD(+) kinase [Sulfolobales archaeon HS-7]|nr:NAD(+) kinase [Sulfolobales archaeon HS-7]